MKIRYILIAIVMLAVAAYMIVNKQNKADYHHCLTVTKLSSIECSYLTNYFPENNAESRGR